MRALACLGFHLALLTAVFASEKPIFEIAKVHAVPGENTREMMLTRFKNPLKLNVDRTSAITDEDVAEALVLEEKDPGIRITLSDVGFAKLRKLMEDTMPGRLVIIVEGKANRILYINRVEYIGAFPVYGDWTLDEAKRIVAALRANKSK